MPAFRHEFYAVAIKVEGGGKAIIVVRGLFIPISTCS